MAVPTKIPAAAPLSKKPPAGKSIYLINSNLPTGQAFNGAFKAAASALGWKSVVLTFNAGDPQASNSSLQQAVDANANYIVMLTNDPLAGPAGKAAAAKKIPIITLNVARTALPSSNGIYSSIDGPTWVTGFLSSIADAAIVDSGGKAHLMLLNYPGASILAKAAGPLGAVFSKNCPQCKLSTLNVSPTDLAGANVPSLVVSALQKDPKITYIEAAFGDLLTGVSAALKAAGLTKVKLMTSTPNTANIAEMKAGSTFAVGNQNNDASMWLMVDSAARLSVGDDLPPARSGITQVWTHENLPSSIPASGFLATPTDYEAQFKALWHAG
jgi:ribose transport system substrate-binding protein